MVFSLSLALLVRHGRSRELGEEKFSLPVFCLSSGTREQGFRGGDSFVSFLSPSPSGEKQEIKKGGRAGAAVLPVLRNFCCWEELYILIIIPIIAALIIKERK